MGENKGQICVQKKSVDLDNGCFRVDQKQDGTVVYRQSKVGATHEHVFHIARKHTQETWNLEGKTHTSTRTKKVQEKLYAKAINSQP